jgi:DNA polymerase/3'-5' exonuclease PolX
MKYQELISILRDHAIHLNESKETDISKRFRALSYERVASKLEQKFKDDNKVNINDINKLDLTDYMKNKIQSIVSDGGIKKSLKLEDKKIIDKDKKASESIDEPSSLKKLNKQLIDIMGIGKERAKDLIKAGITSISQLKLKKYRDLLPEEAKLFLDLKPISPIPHEHIKKLEPYIKKAENKDIKIELVGSYRRKKPTSTDIDVMVVSDKDNALSIFLESIKKTLKVYPYANGPDKLSMIVDMSNILKEKNKTYKIDAFKSSIEDYIPMLLYSTGSKEFNIAMRIKAKKYGYLLNQKGLFKGSIKVKNLNSEEDYFNILNMDYKKPWERT